MSIKSKDLDRLNLEKAQKQWDLAKPPYTLSGFLEVMKENAEIAKGIDPNDESVYNYLNRSQLLTETYSDMIAICRSFILKSEDQKSVDDPPPFELWKWIERAFAIGYLNQQLGERQIIDVIPIDLIPKWERCVEFLESLGCPPKPKRSPSATTMAKKHERLLGKTGPYGEL